MPSKVAIFKKNRLTISWELTPLLECYEMLNLEWAEFEVVSPSQCAPQQQEQEGHGETQWSLFPA